ncbi:hypothetical protein COS83_01410 [archaeon CG07_land_8_20_14_0_80_38_8]|nr:MAG: hypothetical protein COS83_01410 [archaeon CG07_land_8_20_14_0_80_38_8]
MKKAVLVLLPLLLIGAVFAEDAGGAVKSMNMEITINSDLTVTQTLNIEVVNTRTMKTSYIYIFLSDTPSNLQIIDENNTVLNYTSFVANNIYTIRLLDEIMPNSSKNYILKYNNEGIVQKFDNNYIFSYSFTSYYELEDFTIRLILPKGFGITLKEGNTVSPPTSRLFSDGQQVMIEWTEQVDYLETKTYLVFFERIALITYSIGLLFLTGLTCFMLGVTAAYFVLKRRRKDIVTMALTADEKKVVDYVLEKGSNVYQNDAGKALDFSKPKLSKIVHNLEDKNIIKLTPSGRKNTITINKEIL